MTQLTRLFSRSQHLLANPPAPRIEEAEKYGGMGRSNVFPPPGRGTKVAVDALNLIEGDQVTLYWQDPVTPVETRPVPPNLNASMSFDVPADILRRYPPFPPEGPVTGDNIEVEVWYTIFRPFPDELFTSDKTLVTVDWLVPGDPDPDPTTPYVNENLAPLVLPSPVPPGRDLILTIPRWKNAARGDRLNLAWGATQFLVATLTDALGPAGPDLIATVPWAVIDNAGDNIVATYYVLDAVSNHSLWALSVKPDVETGDRLPAPTILGLNDYDELDADDLPANGAAIEVRYPGMLAGDRVTLTWTGQTKEGIPLPEHHEDATVPTPPTAKVTFHVGSENIVPLIDGTARVFYSTVPAAGSPLRRSSSATANVIGTAVALPAPTVREAVGGTLDPAGGATVVVRSDYSFARPTDSIVMLWQGTTSAGALVIEQQDKLASEAVAGELTFVIPKNKLEVIAGGKVEVSYTVRASGNVVVPSGVLSLKIGDLGDVEITLPPPSVDGAVGDTLDVTNIGATAVVRVPANSAFMAGDMVDVAWFGQGSDGTYIGSSAKPANPSGVTFDVPAAVALANIGARVRVQYAFVRAGQSRLSDARTLDVVTSGSLSAPTVDEAVAQELDPLNLTNGFTVRTPANADLLPDDTVTATLTGGSGTTPYTSPAQAGAKGMIFAVPTASLATHLGRVVTVYYTRTRNGLPTASDTLLLGVKSIADGDSRLPTPGIDRVVDGELDMGSFTGDPNILIARWPFIAAGQPVTVAYVADGKTTILRDGSPVTPAEIAGGLKIAMPRQPLDALTDDTPLRVNVAAYFAPGKPTQFPELSVAVRVSNGIVENFSGFPLGDVPTRTVIAANCMLISPNGNPTVGTISNGFGGRGFTTNSYAGLGGTYLAMHYDVTPLRSFSITCRLGETSTNASVYYNDGTPTKQYEIAEGPDTQFGTFTIKSPGGSTAIRQIILARGNSRLTILKIIVIPA